MTKQTEALKLALEALEEHHYGVAQIIIREALEQPVQPADLHNRLADLHLYEEIAEHYAKCAISPEALRDWVAERVNTPPLPMQEPQRPWVGLTDDERNDIWEKEVGWGDPSHDDEDLMKAIEQLLKEKNT